MRIIDDRVRVKRRRGGDVLFVGAPLGGFGADLGELDNSEDEFAVCESIRRTGSLRSLSDWLGIIESHDFLPGREILRSHTAPSRAAWCASARQQLRWEDAQVAKQLEKERVAEKEWNEQIEREKLAKRRIRRVDHDQRREADAAALAVRARFEARDRRVLLRTYVLEGSSDAKFNEVIRRIEYLDGLGGMSEHEIHRLFRIACSYLPTFPRSHGA